MHLSNIVILGIVKVLNSIRTNLAVRFFLYFYDQWLIASSILYAGYQFQRTQILTKYVWDNNELVLHIFGKYHIYGKFFSQTCFIFTYHYGNSDDNSDVKSKTFDSFYGNAMIVLISIWVVLQFYLRIIPHVGKHDFVEFIRK